MPTQLNALRKGFHKRSINNRFCSLIKTLLAENVIIAGMRPLILGVLTGLCWVSGLEPWGYFLLSWLGWAFLFSLLLDSKTQKRDWALASVLAGTVYFGAGFYGVCAFSFSAYVVLTFTLTAVLTAFLFLLQLTLTKRGFMLSTGALFLLYLLTDCVLAGTPLGSMPLQSLFYSPLPFLQAAAIPGLGLNTLILAILGLTFSLAWGIKRGLRTGLISTLLFLIVLTGIYAWGHQRLSAPQPTTFGKRIALIQHNLPMGDLWAEDHKREIYQTYETLAAETLREQPGLIVFPFYDFPEDPSRHPEWFQGLAAKLGVPIILGAHIPETRREEIIEKGFRSKLFYFDPKEKAPLIYEAIMGAPFQPIPEKTAAEYKVIESPLGRIGALVCYEDTRPEIVGKAKRQGAKLLIALSNPGHFQKTMIPRYHLIQDQLRAIESGLPVVRISANGYSAFVDSRGRILKQTELSERKILVQEI